jgi:hypothetical protein
LSSATKNAFTPHQVSFEGLTMNQLKTTDKDSCVAYNSNWRVLP